MGLSKQVRAVMTCAVIAAWSAVAMAGASGRLRLEARFAGPGVKAKATYVEETRPNGARKKLKVEVQNAAAGSSFQVSADGVAVGTIQVNALGRGKLEINSGGDNPNQGNVPVLTAGDVVTVGSASGTLAPR